MDRQMIRRVELGYRVRARDGDAGAVERIVVDPAGREPEYIVVRSGRLRRERRVVPVSLVSGVDDGVVSLDVAREALDRFPLYEVTVTRGTYQKPVPVGRPVIATYTPVTNEGYMALTHRSVPDSSVAVGRDMEVVDARGRRVGRVHGLVARGDDRQGTELVISTSDRPGSQCRIVPVDLVEDASEGRVRLRIAAEHVAGLAPCGPA